MRGVIPPFPQYASWGGVRLNKSPFSEWSASHPGRFTPGVIPCYPPDRKLDGPQRLFGRGGEEKRTLSCLYQEQNRNREFGVVPRDLP